MEPDPQHIQCLKKHISPPISMEILGNISVQKCWRSSHRRHQLYHLGDTSLICCKKSKSGELPEAIPQFTKPP